MTTIARSLSLALSLTFLAAAAQPAHASEETSLTQLRAALGARFNSKTQHIKDYAVAAVKGMQGKALVLKDNVARRDFNAPSVVVLDPRSNVVAVGFTRPNSGKATVLSLVDATVSELTLDTVTAPR